MTEGFFQPRNSDREEIFSLLLACFPEDSRAFLEAVTEKVFTPEESLGIRVGGKIAVFVLLPRFQLSDGRSFGYVYCLCTDENFRGRGLMRKLLARGEELCLARGDSFTALIPADEKLALTYQRLGYVPISYCEKKSGLSSAIGGRKATSEDIPLLNSLYEAEFGSALHIRRSPQLWQKLMELYGADGGGIFTDGRTYVFAEKREKGFCIREKAGETPDFSRDCLLPAKSGIPRVLARGYTGEVPLLNLLFD
ncbi:MAG: GNAT family N-acetyltransferase [Clostridia bacterium]|nr:GNAT family N-acetyltransferase [Clostridia bacterium]